MKDTVVILTWKEIFDEEILREDGRFKFRWFSPKKCNLILAKALSRKRSEGLILRAVEKKLLSFYGNIYYFEKVS